MQRRTLTIPISLQDAARSSVLLGRLPLDDASEVVLAGHGARAARGRALLHAGDDAAVLVLRGVGAVRRTAVSGTQVITALPGPGEVAGLTVALGHLDVAAEVTAIDPIEALVIPGSALRRLVGERAAIAQACLRAVTAELADAQREAALFGDSCTSTRIEVRLLELVERWGVRDGDAVHIGLHLTQDELASWARVSRESAARTLQTLRRAGILATGRRDLTILDLPALQARRRHDAADPMVRELLRHAR